MHTRRRAFRDARQQASAEIGAAFSSFKQYFLGLDVTLPSDIVDSLKNIDILRDKLGGVEIDYDDAEEEYNRQEWNYTQLEENFVDCLPEDTMISRTPELHQEDVSETNYLTQFADATTDTLNYPNLDELVQISLDASKSKMNQGNDTLTGTIQFGESLRCIMPRGARSFEGSTNLESRTRIQRSFSEADLDSRHPEWSKTRHRINAWLLESLRSSTLQQQHLRHVLAQQDWFQTVTRYWFVDSSHVSLHDGDTTVPGSSEDGHPEGDCVLDVPFEDAFKNGRRTGPPSGSRYDPAQYPLPASPTLSNTGGGTGLEKPHNDRHLHNIAGPACSDDALLESQPMQEDRRPTTPTIDDTGPPTDQNDLQSSPLERIDSAFLVNGKEIVYGISERGDIESQIPAQHKLLSFLPRPIIKK